ncbi:uncharacterized protein LOC124190305 isoform X1 [Daphnia pulex]|uniref:uncharacterized protein LOC124328775 n=1 Tax=Daphnia pulicaria TaxID=35523 RepID=UPI001EE05968|nr:uncharacterized protein LOC124190305 isoform X1 [Daphnia pulex]XP_046643571.1 uncharacterized protein LOC124328775 [Daphnia pulicaria]
MNTESLSNHSPPKKDYQQLQKILKGRCEEISKDNDALSSRLINLKLLIYKSENQCKKLKDRLEYHGVDYHTAAAAAAAASNYAEATDFISEKAENNVKSRPKHIRKKRNKPSNNQKSSTVPTDNNTNPLKASTAEFEGNLSSSFPISKDDNLITM